MCSAIIFHPFFCIRSAIKACITRQILPAQLQILKQMGKILTAFNGIRTNNSIISLFREDLKS